MGSENPLVGELFGEIIQWIDASGGHDLASHPGVWRGETDQWNVELNGHQEEIDGLPFAHARLTNKKHFQIAVLSPFDGAIGGGASESAMINHFRSARAALSNGGE